MGWVTLSLRKRELKQEHQYYQLRDLQISREKRALARQKSYEFAKLQAQQKEEELAISKNSEYDYGSVMTEITNLRKSITSDMSEDDKKAINDQIADKQTEYQNKVTAKTGAINDIKTFYDQQKADIEQEVGDEETELEMEQVDVETQMEAISQELQAVSDAISSEIQSSTIKLA